MTPEARRALVERIFEKSRESGQMIENDPLFRQWIEEWIEGDIDIAALRERYSNLLLSRRHSRRDE